MNKKPNVNVVTYIIVGVTSGGAIGATFGLIGVVFGFFTSAGIPVLFVFAGASAGILLARFSVAKLESSKVNIDTHSESNTISKADSINHASSVRMELENTIAEAKHVSDNIKHNSSILNEIKVIFEEIKHTSDDIKHISSLREELKSAITETKQISKEFKEFKEFKETSLDDNFVHASLEDIELMGFDYSGLSSLDDVDEISAKLDLARAYLDMGETDETRDILEKVLDEEESILEAEKKILSLENKKPA